jgi:hypothetical protein
MVIDTFYHMHMIKKFIPFYLRSLLVAVPAGALIANIDPIIGRSHYLAYKDDTCVERMIRELGLSVHRVGFNSFIGGFIGTVYPISGPLYLAHRAEKQYKQMKYHLVKT